ncbi:MAG: DNA translocase FtsK [Acidobacteriota bacterium]|nr:DNA translocase FtsK [Acidobacteriota bacterium]
MEQVSEDIGIYTEEASGESKTTESLKAHRKQVKRKKQRQLEQQPSLARDIAGWLAILAGIAWLLILVSYDPSDPSLFNETSKMPENYLGSVGAHIAALSYQFFGFGNFSFPLCTLYMGYLCVRTRKVNDWFFQIIGVGTVILVLLVFLGSFGPITFQGDPQPPGGIIGVTLWRFFTGYLNPVGTYLFLFGAAGLALLVATQLTLRQIAGWLWSGTMWTYLRLQASFSRLTETIEAGREERMRNRIIQRELDKMESEKQARVSERLKRFRQPKPLNDEDDDYDEIPDEEQADPDFGIRNDDLTGDPEPIPEPSQDLDDEPPWEESKPSADDDDDIKVNPMKSTKNTGQGSFQFMQDAVDWIYPTSFHFNPPDDSMALDEGELREKAHSLHAKFGEFNVTGDMREIHPGPVVTTYEFKPDAGIKYSKVVNLSDDLCLALGAESIRIDRMPGRSAIGIEVPNNKRELITFREMIEDGVFQTNKAKLLMSLGKTIDGTPFCADLSKMPHLLIAGQTGSGKSVGINAMICSILMRCSPVECKFIMIDPKMVELGMYTDIPHLMTPVVTDPHDAANALKWAVDEMERRYRLLASHHVRNLEHYNKSVRAGDIEAEPGEEPLVPLPFVVVVIDEMADLMMVARGEVEESIARLAQKSRAIGIHLILATQRPSVDIITGVIKSNLPSRLAYRVAQRNDSRIILDSNGADKLLGKGDGLFLGPGTARLVRIHAPYLSESEVMDLVKFLKNQGKPDYNLEVVKPAAGSDEPDDDGGGKSKGKKKGAAPAKKREEDPMYEKAARLVVRSGQASVSYLQRKLSLGYARAAKLIDMMEEDGIVGPNLGSKKRDILVSSDFFDGVDSQMR